MGKQTKNKSSKLPIFIIGALVAIPILVIIAVLIFSVILRVTGVSKNEAREAVNNYLSTLKLDGSSAFSAERDTGCASYAVGFGQEEMCLYTAEKFSKVTANSKGHIQKLDQQLLQTGWNHGAGYAGDKEFEKTDVYINYDNKNLGLGLTIMTIRPQQNLDQADRQHVSYSALRQIRDQTQLAGGEYLYGVILRKTYNKYKE